jgi:hypothetical protein
MKRFCALIGFFILVCLAFGQKTEWTIEKTDSSLGHDLAGIFEGHGGGQGGVAKWGISGKTEDEVWDAVMKSLVFINQTTATGDKPSGIITAKRPGALIHFLITASDSGVDLFGKWEFVPGEKMQFSTPFSQTKKFFNELFPKVKEALKLNS